MGRMDLDHMRGALGRLREHAAVLAHDAAQLLVICYVGSNIDRVRPQEFLLHQLLPDVLEDLGERLPRRYRRHERPGPQLELHG